MTGARLRYLHIGAEVWKRWTIIRSRVLVIQLESRWFRRVQGESIK